MSVPAQKCENNAIYNQNYTPIMLLILKWPVLAVSVELS